MKKILIVLMLVLMSSIVFAVDEINQEADRINYWDAETHTVTVTNYGADSVQANFTIPAGFTWNSGTCLNSGSIIYCDITPGGSKTYVLDSSAANAEYYVATLTPTTNNSYTGNDVKFLKIKDDEIFHTLVEYGRGRGNYFFDTYGGGAYAGSGHTGTGCNYVPNGTMFELNFLHKVNNVKQYFGDLNAEVYNASFSCTYPNNTIIRQHLTTAIVTNGTGAFLSYLIPKIEGSWERMGYVGMQFDIGDYDVGGFITVNCTDMSYLLPAAGGYLVVDDDSFSLEVVDKEPFVASAITVTPIGNGTSEVLIQYNITNTGTYTADDVVIEINAPQYATFIGTRGELWGTALDQYRIEKAQLLPGESEIITLVARFDTTNAPSMTSIDLTNGIKIEYVSCWELNAYNPGEYVQWLTGIGNGTVNMGNATQIVNIRDRLTIIINITETINITLIDINNTVNNILTIVDFINLTTQDTNIIVREINSTTNILLNKSEILLNNTYIILQDTWDILDLLNCNGTDDSPICDKIRQINTSLKDLYNFTLFINHTANNLNITVLENINYSGINVSINIDLTNITNFLRDIKTYINCTNVSGQPNTSICNRLERIENHTLIIDSTIESIYNLTTYFNTSVFGNFTFQQIIDKISNTSVDTSEVLERLIELREFNEEVVFLITDSFGLQQSAKEGFTNGDLGGAVTDLTAASAKLQDAMSLLGKEKAIAESETSFNARWVLVAMALILAVSMLTYMLGKPKSIEPVKVKSVRKMKKRGEFRMGVLKFIPLLVLLVLFAGFAKADFGPLGTINQEAGALNFETFKNQTVSVFYNCTGSRLFNVSLPSGFTVTNTVPPCGLINPSLVSCSFNDVFAGNNFGSYTVQATTTSFADHTIFTFPTWLSNEIECGISANISLIKIPNDEVFHTLVEFGRGRGNYFYSTRDGGSAGSGGTGTGCNYVPNGTMFELNFLHKLFNIKQYFDDPYATATDGSFTCTYPNRTIIRSHLGTSINYTTDGIEVSYFIDQIEGSWERTAYLGMQFDTSEQQIGQNLTISCKDIQYTLSALNGDITVYSNGTSFDLQVVDPEPFSVSASTSSTIGNGTQEVLIVYTITNTQPYVVDDVIIEINAPPYSTFIGTQGELWGAALDQYRIEKISLAPGETETIILVARFDTTNAPSITSIDLTSGVRMKYVTCWELNAYNPGETVQNAFNIGNATVNMGIPTSIISVREQIEKIYNLVTYIEQTTINVNNTVNIIESVVSVINSTTIDTNLIVRNINTTINYVLGNVSVALDNSYSIINNTNWIKDLLNCNGTIDTPICDELDYFNETINNISSILIDINHTLSNITIEIDIDLSGLNLSFNVTPDLTNITIILEDIMSELNCSNVTSDPGEICNRLIRIENHTTVINFTLNEINEMLLYFNSTVFGNHTLQEIYERISNITIDTSSLLEEIRRNREFSEELVFLVTDAFGLQQAARQDLNNGDLGAAADKLRQANAKLNEASARLAESQESTTTYDGVGFMWVILLLGVITIGAVSYYMFSKPDVEDIQKVPKKAVKRAKIKKAKK